jgi:hypothetical protein
MDIGGSTINLPARIVISYRTFNSFNNIKNNYRNFSITIAGNRRIFSLQIVDRSKSHMAFKNRRMLFSTTEFHLL